MSNPIRDHVLAHAKPKGRVIEFFGRSVEVRQPKLKEVLRVSAYDDRALAAAEMIVRYTFVPGTNDRVFEDADIEAILELPFGPDLALLQQTITDLSDVELNVKEAGKNSDETG